MSLFRDRGEARHMSSWFASDMADSGRRVITADTAQYLAPVFAAHRHIVDFVSTLPIDAYRRTDQESRKEIGLPKLLSRLEDQGDVGVGQWFGQAAFALASVGNAVGLVTESDSYGYPTSVRWVPSLDWAFEENTKQWRIYGEIMPASRIVHIPWIVPPGMTLGLSPIEHFAAIVGAGLSAQEYADVKRGGGLPPSSLKNINQTLDPESSRAVQARVRASFAKGDTFVHGKDWEFKTVSIPPNHAQFIETLKLSANQIAAIYGIDPREIGGSASESLRYSTDESIGLNRAANMRPYIIRLEQAVSRNLPNRQFIRMNVDATIRADIKTRFEVYKLERDMGTRSINEIRALEDRPPIGPEGDKFMPPADKTPTARETP